MSTSKSDIRTRTALALTLLLVVAFFALFEFPFIASDITIAPA